MFSMIVLSLSHNVAPERGFLINKHLLSIHGNYINEEGTVALRLVKDHLFKVGGPTKVKNTKASCICEKFIPKIKCCS